MGVALEVVLRSRGGLARLLRKLGDLEQRFHDLNRLATFLGLLARDEALGLLPRLECHHPPSAGTRLQADGGVRPRGDRRIILVNERLDATFGRLRLSEIHGRVHDFLRGASAALVRVCCCPSRAAPVAVQQPPAASSSQQQPAAASSSHHQPPAATISSSGGSTCPLDSDSASVILGATPSLLPLPRLPSTPIFSSA